MAQLQEKRSSLFFKGSIAQLKRGGALKTLIVASAGRVESLFVHAKYLRTHCIRTILVPKNFNKAIVFPTIESECTTIHNFSQ